MNCEPNQPPAPIVLAPITKRLESEVARLASTPRTTVAIHGELGVGKRTWARRLHDLSARSSGPFVEAGSLGIGATLDEGLLATAEGGDQLRVAQKIERSVPGVTC